MAKRYYVKGEVYEIIYADTPEEAKQEFINLKGAYEDTVVAFDDQEHEY